MYEHAFAQPRADGDCIPVAPSPLATGASPLSVGADFLSSFQLQNRRTPTDGVASSGGLPVGECNSNVFRHAMFMETYADLESTHMQSKDHKNVKFLF